jgi:hypothetical protein
MRTIIFMLAMVALVGYAGFSLWHDEHRYRQTQDAAWDRLAKRDRRRHRPQRTRCHRQPAERR